MTTDERLAEIARMLPHYAAGYPNLAAEVAWLLALCRKQREALRASEQVHAIVCKWFGTEDWNLCDCAAGDAHAALAEVEGEP